MFQPFESRACDAPKKGSDEGRISDYKSETDGNGDDWKTLK